MDKFIPVHGHFILEVIKDNKVIEKEENHNMIMINSREIMALAMRGDGDYPVCGLILGTEGHETDITDPKDFDYSRTQLFSEENNSEYYSLLWDPVYDGTGLATTITWEGYDTTVTSGVSILSEYEDNNRTIVFTFEIPEGAANTPSGNSAVMYTEAGLYSNRNRDLTPNGDHPTNPGDLFAMRTFSGKYKSPEVSFRITWKISF